MMTERRNHHHLSMFGSNSANSPSPSSSHPQFCPLPSISSPISNRPFTHINSITSPCSASPYVPPLKSAKSSISLLLNNDTSSPPSSPSSLPTIRNPRRAISIESLIHSNKLINNASPNQNTTACAPSTCSSSDASPSCTPFSTFPNSVSNRPTALSPNLALPSLHTNFHDIHCTFPSTSTGNNPHKDQTGLIREAPIKAHSCKGTTPISTSVDAYSPAYNAQLPALANPLFGNPLPNSITHSTPAPKLNAPSPYTASHGPEIAPSHYYSTIQTPSPCSSKSSSSSSSSSSHTSSSSPLLLSTILSPSFEFQDKSQNHKRKQSNETTLTGETVSSKRLKSASNHFSSPTPPSPRTKPAIRPTRSTPVSPRSPVYYDTTDTDTRLWTSKQIATALRTRLTYAKIKLQNGWQSQSLARIEKQNFLNSDETKHPNAKNPFSPTTASFYSCAQNKTSTAQSRSRHRTHRPSTSLQVSPLKQSPPTNQLGSRGSKDYVLNTPGYKYRRTNSEPEMGLAITFSPPQTP